DAFPQATTALTGFGFTLAKAPGQDADKFNHLGRYLGALRFRVDDLAYAPDTGVMSYRHTTQVWAPDTVVDASVTTELAAALIQLSGATLSTQRDADGQLCANSKDAPFFSEWKHCGEPDKGPEQVEDAVTIAAP
ncbi:MAG: hypothetical protein KC468_30155, partial [Myxococcales bacterium]|nr:hypothetical protein [Myxococcales bacterium]